MSAEAEVLCIPIGATCIPLRLDEPMCNVSVGSSGAQTVYLGLASGSPRPSRPLCTEGTFLIFSIGVRGLYQNFSNPSPILSYLSGYI